MITVTLFVVLGVWAIIKYILVMRHTESFVKDMKFQTRSFIPILGNIFSVVGTPEQIFKTFAESIVERDTPVKMYIGTKLLVTLNRPEDAKEILNSPHCYDRPLLAEFSPFKNSLLHERCK